MKVWILLFFMILSVQETIAQYPKQSSYVHSISTRYVAKHYNKGKHVSSQEQYLCAFVQLDDTDADTLLSKYHCKVLARWDDIYIVDIPLSYINSLTAEKNITRIEAQPSCHLTLDTTTTIVDALPAYAGVSLPQVYTGSGVVVGVMDVGFDLTHPTFYDLKGENYRIGAFWDMLANKNPNGQSMYVGKEFLTTDEILSAAHSVDGMDQTHGSHTAGIAAGSGYGTVYRGLAFNSDICLVSNAIGEDVSLVDSIDYYRYTSATDALGFKYIFDYANRVGKPAVASFSEGYFADLSEDNRLYCEVLKRMQGPGKIIVASAGNESVNPTYIHKPKGVEHCGSYFFTNRTEVNFKVKSKDNFSFKLIPYLNDNATATDSLVAASIEVMQDSMYVDSLTFANRHYHLYVGHYLSAFDSLDIIYDVTIISDTPFDMAHPLAFAIAGKNTEIEVLGNSIACFNNEGPDKRWHHAERSHNIHMPAAAESVICVGATSHRKGFVNYWGDYRSSGSVEYRGKLLFYSSCGPTASGLLKPDVVAPGDNIVSSYSRYYCIQHPDASDVRSNVAYTSFQGKDYPWNSNSGTSMATPVVAGAIALWLEANPKLTSAEIKNIIMRTAHHSVDNLPYPNNQYGYGEIDVYRGLLDVLGLTTINDLSFYHSPKVSIIPTSQSTIKLVFSDTPTHPFSVSVYDLSGNKIISRQYASSTQLEYEISVQDRYSTIYAVQVNSQQSGITGSQLVRISQ